MTGVTNRRKEMKKIQKRLIITVIALGILLADAAGLGSTVSAAGNYSLNKQVVNTYTGAKTTTLKVKNAGKKTVKWSSSNSKVAKVSKKGVVTPKKVGTTMITAQIAGQNLQCLVSVSSKKAHKAVQAARKISQDKNVKYSQSLRMVGKNYDCSSLVWRSYSPNGVKFGMKFWAPTAAAQGKWCVDNNKKLSWKALAIDSKKMVAGDTIYYAYSGNNGRYKKISHTAIFAGYKYNPNVGYYGTVIEASTSKNTVVERNYYQSTSIVLTARPTK